MNLLTDLTQYFQATAANHIQNHLFFPLRHPVASLDKALMDRINMIHITPLQYPESPFLTHYVRCCSDFERIFPGGMWCHPVSFYEHYTVPNPQGHILRSTFAFHSLKFNTVWVSKVFEFLCIALYLFAFLLLDALTQMYQGTQITHLLLI